MHTPTGHLQPPFGQPTSTPPPYNQSSPAAPPPQPPPPPSWAQAPGQPVIYAGQWSTGLCGCTSDVSNCFVTCCCPCISFGQVAEIIDKGTTSCPVHGVLYTVLLLTGCQWIYSCMYRSKMRQQYLLPEEPCNDCFAHFFCGPCAMSQEYRELRHRGFDLSLGWYGNMERQNQAVMTPPFAPAGMKR